MLNIENKHIIGYQYSIEVLPELEKGNHAILKDILYKSKEPFLKAGIKEYWVIHIFISRFVVGTCGPFKRLISL